MIDFGLPSEEEMKVQVQRECEPTMDEKTEIHNSIEKQTAEIMSIDIQSFEKRRECMESVAYFGEEILNQSVKKNSILERRMTALSRGGGEASSVAETLEELTIKMRELDPSEVDFVKTGILGKIFSPVRKYFEKYKTADQEIAEIVASLDKGRKILVNDNITLEMEQDSMRSLTKNLVQTIEFGIQLDESITKALEIAKVSGENEEKILFIEEELLIPLRQRLIDFQQLAIVNQQGVVSIELVRKNNKELIRAIDRAKMVTISALRTAVTLAGALYDQKIVLNKIAALNESTEHMIRGSVGMYREQGTELHRQTVESSISIETLKETFSDALNALDGINAYKEEALPRIKQTISDFKVLVEEGENQLRKIEDASM